MVMALSERKKSVDLNMAERAISLLEWQKKVREAYQPLDYTDTMSQIENLIRRAVKKHSEIPKGQLFNLIGAPRFDSWKVNKALENLEKNKEIRAIPTRRTTKYVAVE